MKKQEDGDRRSFLKHVLIGTSAVAGAAVVVKPAKAEAMKTVSESMETLYYESDDFKSYYRSLRS